MIEEIIKDVGRCPTPWQGEVLPAPPARPMDVQKFDAAVEQALRRGAGGSNLGAFSPQSDRR